MADDRMRNDDQERNMGGQQKGQEDYGKGQQSPGRNRQDDDLKTGQRGAGQQQGEQKKNITDDSEESEVGQGGRNR